MEAIHPQMPGVKRSRTYVSEECLPAGAEAAGGSPGSHVLELLLPLLPKGPKFRMYLIFCFVCVGC